MKKQSTIAAAVLAVTAVLAGGACAAEFAGLQTMRASGVMSSAKQAGDIEITKISAAPVKDILGAPAITQVVAPDYICQDEGGGFAIRIGGKAPKIWQLDGYSTGAEEGIELNKVNIDGSGLPHRLGAQGYLSFAGQDLKLDIALKQDPKSGGMALTALLNGEETSLKNVPCRTGSGKSRTAGQRVYAEGTLFSYNRQTRDYDINTGRVCSLTLERFGNYLDTEHGSPREVVSARYTLGGFPEPGAYASGTAVGGTPTASFPYVTLENYKASGLTGGTRVKILLSGVSSAQALLDGKVPSAEIYVTKEAPVASYLGGDGVGWGYFCDLRPASYKAARNGGALSGTYQLSNAYTEGTVTARQFSEGGLEKVEFQLLTASGVNGHEAQISGVALRGQGGEFVFNGEEGCRLMLQASGRVLKISGADATCRAYMGVNAAADGEYVKRD